MEKLPMYLSVSLVFWGGALNANSERYDRGNPRDRRTIDIEPEAHRRQAIEPRATVQAPLTDAALATRIYQEILQDKSLSSQAQDVEVVVEDGNVMLSGALDTETDRQGVAQIADRLVGADKVVNDIVVRAAH